MTPCYTGDCWAHFVTTACFVTKVTKRAAMPAHFVTNEVVTNCAGTAPFFHLDISTGDIVYVTCVFVCVCVCICICVVCVCVGGGGGHLRVHVCTHTHTWVCFDDPSDGYCGCRNTEYPVLSSALSFKKWCTFGGFYAPYNRRQLLKEV